MCGGEPGGQLGIAFPRPSPLSSVAAPLQVAIR